MTTLFDATPGFTTGTDKPRDCTQHELSVYLVWLALRHGVYVPADAQFQPRGIWSPSDSAYILDMPGYGQSGTVTCEILDDAGNVVRCMPLPVDNRGKLPMTAAQAKDWTGLQTVRKSRKAAAKPEHAAAAPEAVAVAPEPVAVPVEAPAPVSEPAKVKAATINRATRAIAMLSGERAGLGTRAFDNCFENGDGEAVGAVIIDRLRTCRETARAVRYGSSSFRDQGERIDVNAMSYLSPAMIAAALDTLGEATPVYGLRAEFAERVEALRTNAPAPVAPPVVEIAPAPEPIAAPQYGSAAADVEAAAAIEAAGLASPTDNEAAPIWRQYVATAYGVGPDGWTLSVGPQRDRKARNRGLVVLDAAAQAVLASHFAALFPQHAPALPSESAPIADVEPPRPETDLAATVAALVSRVAALETAAAPEARPVRSPAHLRAIRAYLRLRAERAALRVDVAQARTNEAAVRKSVQVQARDLMRLEETVETLRGDTVTAELETIQTRAAYAALETRAAADAAELIRLAPVVAALAALNRPAPALSIAA
jgi:hypothetical protein